MFYNVSAVTAHIVDSAMTMDTRESYEQTYYANVGDRASVEEAFASADMTAREDEVGIIKVQRGYVTQRQGKGPGGSDYLQPGALKQAQQHWADGRGQQQPDRCQPGPEHL